MAHLLKLARHTGERGDLTVFENMLPGSLKRVFFITNADGATRGGHRHRRAWQALVCIQGRVEVYVETPAKRLVYRLDEPTQCLLLEPCDWHLLENFEQNAIVLVVSNEVYDPRDYIDEAYSPRPDSSDAVLRRVNHRRQ